MREIFDIEIESCNNNMTRCETYPLFQHQSTDETVLCIRRYSERLFRIMIDASDWIENQRIKE